MSDEQRRSSLDPMRVWREWYQTNEKRWSDQLTELFGDERFASTAGRSFQEMLHAHRMFTEAMGQYLANLNLPARTDILALSDRIGELEDALAGLQVEIRELRSAIQPAQPQAEPRRPKRTRRPPEPRAPEPRP